ncbi:MAG: hypothetical protein HC890_15400 [Chloroflexaceae bacterium]|nr:hypothetical protein [Chloroflexaceae bacterium]
METICQIAQEILFLGKVTPDLAFQLNAQLGTPRRLAAAEIAALKELEASLRSGLIVEAY